MKKLALLAALGLSTSAHAYTVKISDTLFPDNGGFANCVGLHVCSNIFAFYQANDAETIVVAGGETIPNVWVAPAPTGAYWAAAAYGVTATLTAPTTAIQFNWGSMDCGIFSDCHGYVGYNPLAFNVLTLGSTIIGAHDLVPYMTADEFNSATRNYAVTISGLPSFQTVTWQGTKFEFNDVGIPGTGAAPELSTWAMLVAGFASMGFLGLRKAKLAPIG